GEQLAKQRSPDPVAAVFGQERDVDDPDLARATVNVEAPSRLAVDDNDIEARICVVLAPPSVLRGELAAQEGVLLGVVPRHHGELLRAGAGVHAVEELAVARLDRAKLDGLCQLRGG